MTRLVVIGEDLGQVIAVGAAAGTAARTTSLVHTRDPGPRVMEALDDPEALVVVVCAGPSGATSGLPDHPRLIVVRADVSGHGAPDIAVLLKAMRSRPARGRAMHAASPPAGHRCDSGRALHRSDEP